MMRRFYKSRLFWCGVPGLVFLLWVWWDSGKHSSDVVWRHGLTDDALAVVGGRVEWRKIVWVPGMSRRVDGFSTHHSEMREMDSFDEGPRGVRKRQFDFPQGFMVLAERGSPGAMAAEMRRVQVALWVVVLGYVGTWLGAVWWQEARVRRHLTEVPVEAEKEVAG